MVFSLKDCKIIAAITGSMEVREEKKGMFSAQYMNGHVQLAVATKERKLGTNHRN